MGLWNRVYRVNAKNALNLRPHPSTSNSPLVKLSRGQIVARLNDEIYPGNWFAVFADLGDRAYTGYVASWLLEPLRPDTQITHVDPNPPSESETEAHDPTIDEEDELIHIPPEDQGDSKSIADIAPPSPPDQALENRTRADWEGEWISLPSSNWRGTVGASFTPEEFEYYVRTLNLSSVASQNYDPRFVAFHHTWRPNLDDRPAGFSRENIRSLARGYEFNLDARGRIKLDAQGNRSRRWRGAPHLFVDDRRIWVLTPLTARGTHAAYFNKDTIGIEMLGNFLTQEEQVAFERVDRNGQQGVDNFDSGRGLRVQENAISAAATLMNALGLDPTVATRFHRDDRRAKEIGKQCPGGQVDPSSIIAQLLKETERRRAEFLA